MTAAPSERAGEVVQAADLFSAKSLSRRKSVKEFLEACDLSLLEGDHVDEIGFVGLAG